MIYLILVPVILVIALQSRSVSSKDTHSSTIHSNMNVDVFLDNDSQPMLGRGDPEYKTLPPLLYSLEDTFHVTTDTPLDNFQHNVSSTTITTQDEKQQGQTPSTRQESNYNRLNLSTGNLTSCFLLNEHLYFSAIEGQLTLNYTTRPAGVAREHTCHVTVTAPIDYVFYVKVRFLKCRLDSRRFTFDVLDEGGSRTRRLFDTWHAYLRFLHVPPDIHTFTNKAAFRYKVSDVYSPLHMRVSFVAVSSSEGPQLEVIQTSPMAGYIQTPGFDGTSRHPLIIESWARVDVPEGHAVMLSRGFTQIEKDGQGKLSHCYKVQIFQISSLTKTQVWDYCSLQYFRPTVLDARAVEAYASIDMDNNPAAWFRLMFSFHNHSQVPQKLPDGKWNCSVPYWTEFQHHFPCDLVRDCEGGEDEIHCPYTTPRCGPGYVTAGGSCFLFVSVPSDVRISWDDASNECQRRGLQLASLNTPTEWDDVTRFTKKIDLQPRSWRIYIGLRSAHPSLPIIDFLCEKKVVTPDDLSVNQRRQKIRLPVPETRLTMENFVTCPNNHTTHIFLACDANSDCLGKGYGPFYTCDASMTPLPPSLACASGMEFVPYTLVCDHRSDCGDGSDEDFCVFKDCDRMLGQCVASDNACDMAEQCMNGADENQCSTTLADGTDLHPPAELIFDKTGTFATELSTFPSLQQLHLSGILMQQLNSTVLSMFPNVMTLNLSGTSVDRVLGVGFQSLPQLSVLDLRGCPLTVFPRTLFEKLDKLHSVSADHFTICCQDVLPPDFNLLQCLAPNDEISSFEGGNYSFGVTIWLNFFLFSFVGLGQLFIQVSVDRHNLLTVDTNHMREIAQVQSYLYGRQVQPPFYRLQVQPPFYRLQVQPPFYRRQVQAPFYRRQVQAPFYRRQVQAPFYRRQVQPPFYRRQVQAPFYRRQVQAPFYRRQVQSPLYRRQVQPPFYRRQHPSFLKRQFRAKKKLQEPQGRTLFWLKINLTSVPESERPQLEVIFVSLTQGFVQTPGWDGQTPYQPLVDSWARVDVPKHHVVMVTIVNLDSVVQFEHVTLYAGNTTDDHRVWRTEHSYSTSHFYHSPAPRVLNTSALHVHFNSKAGFSGKTGWRLHFSFHNHSFLPQQLNDGRWNCSVPHWTDFQQHFPCNLVSDCDGGQDEAACPYSTGHCGQGRLTAGGKCLLYVTSQRSITWEEAAKECLRRDARLASLKTPEEWRDVISLLEWGHPDYVYIGLRTSSARLPQM
ncbi:hypothetical protein BaRGS_00007111 [Batillaria attramentaria]|uniref:Uncharacterized protein n=1 Tax=Batillaria attramentaria TaxID=370345 RepID=A0ABD0LQ54_9CAEN